MTDGKNAVGLTGFPTPNTVAGIAGYLLFLFEDKEWAQWILGALEPLAYAYNFYESGDLSPDEAAEAFRLIIQDAPYNLKTCANPAGGKIIRVAPNGHVQQLSDSNTWEDPTGDYEIPPVPARTDGSPPDQICLASKNAAHVLELLYENVTDSFNDDLDSTEAATALVLGIISLIGVEFAPITFALVTFFGIVFGVLYGLLEFIGADLWDENFTEALVCILQECATNDAGVVTFDYECFNNKLAAQVVINTLTVEQLRLFGQIQYLLLVIGGVDALNQAGATTAITDDDCSFCEGAWCYEWSSAADLLADGWEYDYHTGLTDIMHLDQPMELTALSFTWTNNGLGTGGDSAIAWWHGVGLTGLVELITPISTDPSPYEWTGIQGCDAVAFGGNAQSGSGGTFVITGLHLEGEGDHPSWSHGMDCS